MKDMMEYKGYFGSVHYNDEDRVFYGQLEFIPGLMSYEGHDVDSLRAAFEEAVEDYLDLCRTEHREPTTPFKGSFSVRVGSEVHRQTALAARQKGLSLNAFVSEVLRQASTEVLAEPSSG